MTDPRTIRAPSGFHPDRGLDREDLLDDPFALFQRWLDAAAAANVPLPNAMAVATAGADGRPSVRHVLLRGIDHGFVFYTNLESRKGRQLAENPRAGLVFLWKELDRQVCVTGDVEQVGADQADAYFASRPRDARIGAWASPQSAVLNDRAELDSRVAEAEGRFAGDNVPRPASWGGFRVIPDAVEFWQGRTHRLHDRFRYARASQSPTGWRVERLAP